MTSELERFLDQFLGQVKSILLERASEYGPPESSFTALRTFWSQAIGRELSASQVVLLLTLLKISRLAWSQDQPDSWVDLAGYAALGAYLREKSHGQAGPAEL